MWIERIHALAFGPLNDRTLELGPGMNVIVGPNESGKSSWHGALYAALCGLRRTKGSRKSEEREFISRHKPWNRSQWQVTATLHTATGRTIEVRQNLANLVDCRATDLALGRDVSGEIMNGGSPDASRWLGLERASFRVTACVRQADVLEVQRSPRVLQSALQRAAASVPADATAAEALLRLQEFEAEQVGSERAPTRPLRLAQASVERAVSDLRVARDGHLDYVLLAAEASKASVASDVATSRLSAAHAARAEASAQAMDLRLGEVLELSRKFEGKERPRLASLEDTLAQEVSAALDRFNRRPQLPSTGGRTAEAIRRDLLAGDGETAGDREMHPTVESAWRTWWEASNALQRHRREEPADLPPPPASGLTADELTDFAAEVAYAPQPSRRKARTATEKSPAVLGMLGVLATLGILVAILGAVFPGAIMVTTAIVIAAWLAGRRNVTIAPELEQRSSTLVAHLEELGLPLNGPALRELAASVREYERTDLERQRWRSVLEQLTRDDRHRQEELRRAIRDRGHSFDDSEMTADALRSYQEACLSRRDGVARSSTLRGELELAEVLERQHADAAAELVAIANQLHGLAHATGAVVEDGVELEFVVAALRGWETQRQVRLGELDEKQRDWSRMEALLDGHTMEELEVHVGLSRNVARTARIGIADADFAEAINAFQSGSGQAHIDAAAKADQVAREELARQNERLRMKAGAVESVAAAEESLESARLELERLKELAEVVRLTQKFMASAADRAHRTIAPVIQASLSKHISAATHGRYLEALVDPETLEVRVRTAGGYWRSAIALSHGTTEQVYLLLRVALAEHLVVAGECSPLILDEVTVHSDAHRTEAILDTLQTLSEGRQVIVFSQEDEVASWARSNLQGNRDRLIQLSELPV